MEPGPAGPVCTLSTVCSPALSWSVVPYCCPQCSYLLNSKIDKCPSKCFSGACVCVRAHTYTRVPPAKVKGRTLDLFLTANPHDFGLLMKIM